MKSYIYLITCSINGKQYVGKTNDPEMRRWDHFYRSQNSKHKQVIHSAIAKYGKENFTFEVILECESEELAFEAEHTIILEKRAAGIELYNMNDGGFGGFNPSKESREKLSRARKGMKFSEETNRKISNVVKRYWEEIPEEKKAERIRRLQEAGSVWRNNLTIEKQQELFKKRSEASKGRAVDEETRKKISETLKKKNEGKPRAHEQIEEYVVACIYCGKEMVRKKPKTFAPQSDTPTCKSCHAHRAYATKCARYNYEPRYDNTSCTTCHKELPLMSIKVSADRLCPSCRAKKAWDTKRNKSKVDLCDSSPKSPESS